MICFSRYRRLYCSNCLTKTKERILCKRCVVFTTRPLSKIELLKLKAKDLIFYLQSKHISTTGCVGKLRKSFSLNTLHNRNSHFRSQSYRKRGISKFGVDSRGQFDKFLTRLAVIANIIFNGHGSERGCTIESIRSHPKHMSKSIFDIHRENCGR